MQKENQNQKEQDNKLFDLATNFLTALQRNDAERINEAHCFFKEAFVLLTDHELFEDVDFRLKWTGFLSFFENISRPLEGHTSTEIETALKSAVMIIQKRKEAYNAN